MVGISEGRLSSRGGGPCFEVGMRVLPETVGGRRDAGERAGASGLRSLVGAFGGAPFVDRCLGISDRGRALRFDMRCGS
jgi:hypothetical protein